ncbi:MAG: hypothetical protein GX362_01220 [Methanosarcinaceae archaeon]|nr:hypothetical protein [Methanosarcinaceae archaeon]
MVTEMTSKERVIAMLNRKPVDRIPIITGSTMVVENINKSGAIWPDLHKNAEMMIDVSSKMYTDIGVDSIIFPFSACVEAASLGLEVSMGRIDIHPSVKSFFKSPDDVDYSKFLESDFVKTTIEAAGIAKDKYPDAAKSILIVGPVTLAGYLAGANNLSKLSIRCLQKEKYMDTITEWLEVALDVNKIYAKACINAGADYIQCGDPSASTNLVMPEFYNKVAVPFEKELGDFIKSKGLPWVLHICGNMALCIEGMAKTGANCLSIEQTVDMKDAVRLAGDTPVAGNIAPLLVVDGTYEDIIKSTRYALDSGAKASMLGCGTPPLSTSDRLKTWVKAVHDWSSENM